jgi:FKBP-type peptidyl-prolyl cis-trans isomerase 2
VQSVNEPFQHRAGQGISVPSLIEPGMRVRHPDRPDWGEGQVQSVIGDRITVNFEHAGKLLINAALVELEVIEAER